MSNFNDAARRARRLAHWYPAAWRERYGAEFEATLESDIEDTTHSLSRLAGIAWGGCRARLEIAGLVDDALEPTQQRKASLVVLTLSSLTFLTFGLVTWSKFQLGSNFRFTAGGGSAFGVSSLVMSWAFASLLVVAIVAVVPLWFLGMRQALRQRSRRMAGRLCLLPASVALLEWSVLRFDATWRNLLNAPSPGNANLHLSDYVFQAFIDVRAFVGRPAELFQSRPDVRTMTIFSLLGVLALILMVIGVAALIRPVELSPRVLAYETRMAQLTLAVMTVACASTLVALFAVFSFRQAGVYANQHLAEGSVVVMTIALFVASTAAWHTRHVETRRATFGDVR